MLRNEQQLNHRILLLVACVMVSAIIVLWVAYLPIVTGSILTKLNIVQWHTSYDYSINRLHKGDRLGSVQFVDRWNVTGAIIKASHPAGNAGRIPEGCEPVFGRLVRSGNFTAFCVTHIDLPMQLALAR